MTFVIHIWESPIPLAAEEAHRTMVQLREQPVGEHPKLAAFAQALWDSYPRDPDTDENDPVWSDGPVVRPGPRPPICTLGIMTSYLGEVLPFVAQTARDMGLVMYDPQTGHVSLPSDKESVRMPLRGAAEPEELRERDVEAALVEALTPFMASEGFKWRKTDQLFACRFKGGEHDIQPVPGRGRPGVQLDFVFGTHLDVIDEIVNKVAFPGSTYPIEAVRGALGHFLRSTDPELASRLLRKEGAKFLVAAMREVQPLAEALISIFRDRLIPELRRCESVHGVWHNAASVLESDQKQKLRGSIWGDVVAGKLAGDPRYEDVAKRFIAAKLTYIEALRKMPGEVGLLRSKEREHIQYLEFVNYVRTQVQPLPGS